MHGIYHPPPARAAAHARWHITLDEGETVIGGALAPGTLYVATENGRIYALSD